MNSIMGYGQKRAFDSSDGFDTKKLKMDLQGGMASTMGLGDFGGVYGASPAPTAAAPAAATGLGGASLVPPGMMLVPASLGASLSMMMQQGAAAATPKFDPITGLPVSAGGGGLGAGGLGSPPGMAGGMMGMGAGGGGFPLPPPLPSMPLMGGGGGGGGPPGLGQGAPVMMMPGMGLEVPVRPGKNSCPFFMKTGKCQYGPTCRFSHPVPPNVMPFPQPLVLGRDQGMDHPKRPDEPPCDFFVKTGKCKFGSTCKFDHPESVASPDTGVKAILASDPVTGTTFFTDDYESYKICSEYPQRPGQEACSFFVQHGTCRFKDTCKFDHPPPNHAGRERSEEEVKRAEEKKKDRAPCQYFLANGKCSFDDTCRFRHVTQEDMNSKEEIQASGKPPIRPGQPACRFFMKTGKCAYGATCKWDHPERQPAIDSKPPGA
eukprot:CAMPEP_0113936662 /NCGR_PEP_ID=MMETSP1339-20121228/3507_1 /TAXON_ID=94617 /ORGANISM="Fibrocapsa japonica" /LENGTH=431 /DNA_ID=CAMNT_0000939193 /DNA_START=94 /DNA_END=1389 /DNA_ORIENTATION=- /assembly_acc=CAM_ASM_000762